MTGCPKLPARRRRAKKGAVASSRETKKNPKKKKKKPRGKGSGSHRQKRPPLWVFGDAASTEERKGETSFTKGKGGHP